MFRPVDATDMDIDRTYSFPILEDGEFEMKTVEFERVEADSQMELEYKLNEKARDALKESGSSFRKNVGYEIVRDAGPHYQVCAFIVVVG